MTVMSHRPIRRRTTTRLLLTLLAAAVSLPFSGCLATQGPQLGILSVPIPVSPYLQTKKEDEHYEQERYKRVPILGPLTAGGPRTGMDPPSDDEVMRAFYQAHPLKSGMPFFYDVGRNDVRIVKEKIGDYVDPPRFVPLIGPAQLHHVHYKVTVYYQEIVRVGWPVPHTLVDDEAQEVLYIDHNHFHMVGNPDTGKNSPY
jgi:hypothetical protein